MKRFYVLISVILIASAFGYGQVNNATLLGQVTDASGAVIPNAHVSVSNTDTNLERTATTDGSGNYEIPSLTRETYKVTIKAAGFKASTREGISLTAGDQVRIDFLMTPGQVNETVVVTAEAPLVHTVSPELGVVIGTNKVTNLPLNGRSFTDLVRLQPGVQSSNVGERQAFSLNGSSQWGLNIALDGIDSSFIEARASGTKASRLTTVSLDSIQEFRVQTGTFSADTGRASGGAINVITKSGTNQFHGTLFEYVRNDAFDARNFFATGAVQKNERRQNQFGGSLGGPLIKDKLFFFGNYEGARLRIGQIVQGTVPTAAFRQQSPAVYQPFFNLVPLPTDPIINNGTVNPNAGLERRNDQFS